MTPDFIRLVTRMLCAFEQGTPEPQFGAVYIFGDGNGGRKQVTLSLGFTADGTNLAKVLRRYISKGGLHVPKFQEALGKPGPELVGDREFLAALKSAGAEPSMQAAQLEIFQEVYLQPALKWAADHGFVLPLSNAVVIDSFLHSGGMLDFLMKRFPESKPVSGGDEHAWIKAYVRTRYLWLVSKGKPLSNTVYRMNFFSRQIAQDNWAFACPLIANGSTLC